MTPELVKQIALSLDAQGKSKMIMRDGAPYLKRYYLFRDDNIAVYLHQFFASDQDEWLHDHPWDSGNMVISGGYFEEVFSSDPDGDRETYWRPPGYICQKRTAETFHRIILPEGKEGNVWTIFWRWRRRRIWGFLVDNKTWVDHKEYLKI